MFCIEVPFQPGTNDTLQKYIDETEAYLETPIRRTSSLAIANFAGDLLQPFRVNHPSFHYSVHTKTKSENLVYVIRASATLQNTITDIFANSGSQIELIPANGLDLEGTRSDDDFANTWCSRDKSVIVVYDVYSQ
jgi:hypothetical protein